mgnify:CR=1 FL=1
MSVTIAKIEKAQEELKRFFQAAIEAKKKLREDNLAQFGCKETAALKRASMDLTRVLVEIRK